MSYLQTYTTLCELGAPVAHHGRTPLKFYADRASTQLHGDPTCANGATPRHVHTTLDQLISDELGLCATCGRTVLAASLEQQLVLAGVVHTRLAATVTLTVEVQDALRMWSADMDSARRLLDRCMRLLEASKAVAEWVGHHRSGRVEPALADWMTTLTDDASAVLAVAAAALRADPALTSALTGVPLGGPARWVLMERIAYLLHSSFAGLDQHVALVAYWPRVGTSAAQVNSRQQLLVAVPEQLAARLTNPPPGGRALADRLPVHTDAGPAARTDDPGLSTLALKLMTSARPTDPLWDPSAAVVAARGVLLAA